MDINIKLAKRAAEIVQESKETLNYLNINAALHQAAIDFKREMEESE
jgi:hypothetical protein